LKYNPTIFFKSLTLNNMVIKSIVSKQNLGVLFDLNGIEPNKINPKLPVVNTTPLTSIPTITNNVLHINEIVTGSDGNVYFIDYLGNSKRLNSNVYNITTITSQTTLSDDDYIIAEGVLNYLITLPQASLKKGHVYIIKTTGGDKTISNYVSLNNTVSNALASGFITTLVSDGVNWQQF